MDNSASGNPHGVDSSRQKLPLVVRPCTRCRREAVVVLAADERIAAVSACAEHLGWAFFLGVDEWTGRRRTA